MGKERVVSERIEWYRLSARERDAVVATRVMGWTRHRIVGGSHAGDYWKPSPWRADYVDPNDVSPDCPCLTFEPSTDIAAAWEVVEQLIEDGYSYYVTNTCCDTCESGNPLVWFMHEDERKDDRCEHEDVNQKCIDPDQCPSQ